MTTTIAPVPPHTASPKSAINSASAPSLWVKLGRMQTRYPLVQGVIFVVAFGYGALAMPGFASLPSIRSMLVLASLVGIAAIGQTFVVLLGGFDLSVSGFIVAGALMVTQFALRFHVAFGWAFVLMLAGSTVLGGLTGYICHRFRAQPIIVTLAMGSIAVGLVQSQIGGNLGGSAPLWLSDLTSPIGTTFGLPIPPIVVIWVVLMLLLAVVIYRTTWGRRLMATGANPRAAEYSLIRTRKVWIMVFAFSAVAASFAGVLLAGYAGSVDQTIGDPYLFQSLAAVIVGGTAFGGPGDYWRTAGGALLLTVLTVVLLGLGLTGADQNILYGIVILLAMTLYGRERRIRDRV
jgi:ribose transport system permease protein